MGSVALICQLAFIAQATKGAVDRLVDELCDRTRSSSVGTGEDLDGTAHGKPARARFGPLAVAKSTRGRARRLSSLTGPGPPRVQGQGVQLLWQELTQPTSQLSRPHAESIGAEDGDGEPESECSGCSTWSEREWQLFNWSQGNFHPDRMAATHRRLRQPGSMLGRVTMCCPTTDRRHQFHYQLWEVFNAMAWDDKELVVVETFRDSPSSFLMEKAKEDARLIYVSFRRPAGEDWSLGLKRNMCTHLSSGEILAHLDDDDIYAPNYISTMVHELRAANAMAVTLSAWYVFDANSRRIGLTDCKANGDNMRETFKGQALGFLANIHSLEDSWLYGFGFSYVYYRAAAIEQPYENMNMCEDYNFYCQLRKSHYVHYFRDPTGIVLHTLHGGGMSFCVITREVHFDEFLSSEVAEHAMMLKDYYPQGEMPALPSDTLSLETAKAAAFADRLQSEGLSAAVPTENPFPLGKRVPARIE